MVIKTSRSKPVSYFCLALFFLLLVNTSYLDGTIEQSGQAEAVFREGVELYKTGEYIRAIEKFSRVLILTKNQVLLADNYFYLSLCNYYLDEKDSAKEWIKKVLEIEPGREVSAIYPADYVALFAQAKREAATEQLDQARRTQPEVAKQPPREQPRQQPEVYYRESEKKGGGGGKTLLILLGGALIAGGAAFLLLQKKDDEGGTTDANTGNIQVSSTPTGAAIYLDGSNTGQTTNATLTDKSPGSHTVKLVKDGYEDYEMSVSVTAGQTITVSATLTAHTIAITSPNSSTAWVRGEQAEIQWTSNAVVSAVGNNLLQRRLNRILNSGTNFSNLNRMRLLRARSFRRAGVRRGRTGAGSAPYEAGDGQGVRTQNINRGGSYSRTGETSTAQISEQVSETGQNAAALNGIPGRFASPYSTSVQGMMEPLAMPNIKIELYRGSTKVNTIAENTANDGSHKWNVPNSLTIANNYKVRISCATDSGVYEDSEAFGVTDFGKLIVKSTPAGAKIYIDGTDSGKKTPQTFNKAATGNRSIMLEKEGYDDWQDTALVEAGKTTNVNATLDKLKLVIVSPKDTDVWDKGNQATITWNTAVAAPPAEGQDNSTAKLAGSQAVRITQNLNRSRSGPVSQRGRTGFSTPDGRRRPNRQSAGLAAVAEENWRALTDLEIKDRGITEVKIELYKGAAKVATIVNKTPNNGSYTWDVPDSVAYGGNNYWVKLICVGKPTIKTDGQEFVITDMTYQFDLTWGSSGSGNGQFNTPYGIAHSQEQPRGIFVSDGQNHRIQKFKDDGTYVLKWGANGSANNQYSYPVGVAVHYYGTQQYVYIADWGNHRIQKTSRTGTWIRKWGTLGSGIYQFNNPSDVACDKNGFVYIVDNENNRVQKYTSLGIYQKQWGSLGGGPSQFNEPYGIAIDHIGNVYVTDVMNRRVQKFNTEGQYKDQWGSAGTGTGQFGHIYGIEVDRWGFVYVTDWQQNRIQKFTSDGIYLLEIDASLGVALNKPWGICVDGYGRIYVANSGNHRIIKYNTD